jgi:hypothetical protein
MGVLCAPLLLAGCATGHHAPCAPLLGSDWTRMAKNSALTTELAGMLPVVPSEIRLKP